MKLEISTKTYIKAQNAMRSEIARWIRYQDKITNRRHKRTKDSEELKLCEKSISEYRVAVADMQKAMIQPGVFSAEELKGPTIVTAK